MRKAKSFYLVMFLNINQGRTKKVMHVKLFDLTFRFCAHQTNTRASIQILEKSILQTLISISKINFLIYFKIIQLVLLKHLSFIRPKENIVLQNSTPI